MIPNHERRIGLLALLLATWLACGLNAQVEPADEDDDWGVAEQELAVGRYREAITRFRAALERDPSSRGDRFGLAHALLAVGQTDAATELLGGLVDQHPRSNRYRLLRGLAHRLRGRLDAAAADFRAVLERAPEHPEAHARLGALLRLRGKSAAAREHFEAGVRAVASDREDAEAQFYSGLCLRGLGRLDAASERVLQAIQLDPELYDAHAALLGLYFDANYRLFGSRGAYVDVRDNALRNNPNHPGVHLALADIYRARNEHGRAKEALDKALAVNPTLVPALCLKAYYAIDRMDFDAAARHLDEATATDPTDRETIAYRAAFAWLRDDRETAEKLWTTLDVQGRADGEPFYIAAQVLDSRMRYADAYGFAKRAVDTDATHWKAWDAYARYSLHTGREAEAIRALRHADKHDRFASEYPWRHNLLKFFDEYVDEFISHEWGPFKLRLHAEDNPVLARYIRRAIDDAHRELSKKYGFTPKGPIRVEVFNRLDDFSVRTVGVPGVFGVLGACFGHVITMNSPRALAQMPSEWESTLWHEYAHVVTLQMSDYRVSRWLTEGLSLFEQKARNPRWEDTQDEELYTAFANRDFAPIKELDGWFRTSRISFAYLQSLHLVEFIVAELGGFEKTLAMLDAYRRGLDTEAAIRDVFGLGAKTFDRRFTEYVQKRFDAQRIQAVYDDGAIEDARTTIELDGKDVDALRTLAWAYFQRGKEHVVDTEAALGRWLAAAPRDGGAWSLRGQLALRRGDKDDARRYFARALELGHDEFYFRLALGALARADDKVDEAIEHFERAKALFPRYPDPGGPYELLAELYEKKGDADRALAQLEALVRLRSTDVRTRRKLARALEKRGRDADALEQYRAINRVTPFVADVHAAIARLLRETASPGAREALEEARQEIDLAILLLDVSDSREDSADRKAERRADLRLERARILSTMGDSAGARAEANAALKDRPEHEGLRAFLDSEQPDGR